MSQPNLTLYTTGTPNGRKVSIALEELGLSYEVRKIALRNGEQKEPWFLKLNPNGKIPVIVDHNRNDFSVFESGAILLYLCENYDPTNKLLPKDNPELKSEVIQWLMFQMAGIGPNQGQAYHFINYQKIPYSIKRYTEETKRLYSVIENRLEGRQYLVGEQLTIADIAIFPWVPSVALIGISLDEYPNIKSWYGRIKSRDAVKRGLNVPEEYKEIDQKKAEEIAAEVQKYSSDSK